ncbi:putative 3-beta hydroxysteroid dehydrogenase isomerase [Cladorrhinum samala]|uniref:3-beta hydroxysteroid dehydrogenase isomerase n=1 Tax=Cladorrhinum samala TaxID=585594 RepID=A0AAV9HV98_9PEZI|nr:putative 3-beta hydroxysteroid dehydrogenase isomerase [Cladorrhinum samala]
MLGARPRFTSQLDFVTIPDFGSETVDLTDALEGGIDGIIHVASPLSYDTQNNEAELIIPAINGVKAVLAAAARTHGRVKRVVITSSFASVIDLDRNLRAKEGEGYFTYTAGDWNPLSYEDAADPRTDAVVAYRGSKKFAELAAWEFVNNYQSTAEDASCGFDIVTLCPPMTFGPVVHPVRARDELNESNAMIWKVVKYLKGEGEESLPVSRVPFWVDVRDLAEAHALALLKHEAGGKRYLVTAPERFSYGLAGEIMRHEFPDLAAAGEMRRGAHEKQSIDESYGMDGSTAARDLGVTYRKFKETVVDLVRQLAAMHE